jgi:hypothetical protein
VLSDLRATAVDTFGGFEDVLGVGLTVMPALDLAFCADAVAPAEVAFGAAGDVAARTGGADAPL